MRSIMVFAAILFSGGGFLHSASAQVGLKAGVSMSRFVGSDAMGAQDITGVTLGASLALIRLGPVAIVPEFHYVQRGALYSDRSRQIIQDFSDFDFDNPPSFDWGSEEIEYNLDYLDVPILVRIGVAASRKRLLRPYLVAGPVYSFKLGCDAVVVTGVGYTVHSCGGDVHEDFSSRFSESDLGFVVGAGMGLQLFSLGAVTVDARLSRSISPLRQGSGSDDIYNQTFSLAVGYAIRI